VSPRAVGFPLVRGRSDGTDREFTIHKSVPPAFTDMTRATLAVAGGGETGVSVRSPKRKRS